MKISIVYDSQTGNTAKAAGYIIQGIESVDGVEAKGFNIDDFDEEYVKESDALIVGTPTYSGSLSGKMKCWLEANPRNLNVAGKLGGAFATAGYVHGGAELAIECVLVHLMVAGMMVYSGGAAFGRPVIHLGPVALASNIEDYAETFKLYGQRMAQQALALQK